ncbi:thiamine phosphate synthase [Apilactobacillus sp. TMW 2.2459]|uniref:thiamine phosphate synthase n=1 Tax=Apilactobacillus xinyiensis TaxID=2841032 RepID=UPI00200C1BBA|nr:thiamine phosphate synthase [Apilactobacillus xinyiensis]MCL0312160.1 thiamine phosphate synthase [Apilactobacillus xinyiensis]
MKSNKKMLDVYFIIGTQNVDNSTSKLLDIVEQACVSGVTSVQFREKDGSLLNFSEKIKLGKSIHKITKKYNIPLFIDDDVNLAIAVNAEGIHVGQSDENVKNIKNKYPRLKIGLSIHDLNELNKCHSILKLVDYIGVGPIFRTNSKNNINSPIGVDSLSSIAKKVDVPVIAIGGINVENVNNLKSI